MAWQLIYTSAPRLLEAGRSGFGTIARHRQISPLLVAAIERFSQFSRLPGLDPDRRIFAHRIVAAGSGRFHVLSFIRDAGADYTGRTNHLAHHLILEPREAAALGRSGVSPGDVLLAASWRQSWEEPPRWLEADDEVSLGHLLPQTSADGTAWAQVTGNAHHPWLLAQGEGSRSACLLTPRGLDLRPLFAESLRLTPERLWQIPFTTSLQPSDDPADFRWAGVEVDTAVATTAASGRTVFDLSQPQTLPEIEFATPAAAPAAPAPEALAVNPAAAASPAPIALQPARFGRSAKRKEGLTESDQKDPLAAFHSARPKSKTGLLIAAAVAFVCVVVVVAWWQVDHHKAKREQQGRLLATLGGSKYLQRPEIESEISQWLATLSRTQLDAVGPVMQLASTFAEKLETPAATLRVLDASRSLNQTANEAGVGGSIPASLKDLANGLELASENAEKIRTTVPGEATIDELQKIAQSLRQPANVLEKPAFTDLRGRLVSFARAQALEALEATFEGKMEPKEGPKGFREAVRSIPEAELEEPAQQRRKKLLAACDRWDQAINGTAHPPAKAPKMRDAAGWPVWLEKLAQTKLAAAAPPPAAPVAPSPAESATPKTKPGPVIYFAQDRDSLASLSIKELKPDLSFEWRTPGGPSTFLGFKNGRKLRKNFGSQNDGLEINGEKLSTEANFPNPPFAVTAFEAASKEEVFSIYVGWPTSENPLISRSKETLKLSAGDEIIIPVAIPRIGSTGSRLVLQTPPKFDGEKSFMLLAKNGGFDVGPAKSAIRARVEYYRKNADSLRNQASTLENTDSSPAGLQKHCSKSATALKSDSAKNARKANEQSPGSQWVGELAQAFAYEWMDAEEKQAKPDKRGKDGEKKQTPASQFEALRNSATALADAPAQAAAVQAANEALKTEASELRKKLKAKEYSGLDEIIRACALLELIVGGKKTLDDKVQSLRHLADAESKRAKEIEGMSPLMQGILPSGEYRVVCQFGSASEIVLYTFHAP